MFVLGLALKNQNYFLLNHVFNIENQLIVMSFKLIRNADKLFIIDPKIKTVLLEAYFKIIHFFSFETIQKYL